MKFKKKENIDFEVDWILSRMKKVREAKAKKINQFEKKINYYEERINRLEKKINKYITLKLVNGKTYIYVNGRMFIQCIRLILNIPNTDVNLYDEIDSIDEAAKLYEKHVYQNKIVKGAMAIPVLNQSHDITPEQEFWGHCSNIQAWVEHFYDTRILMSNISFPLLRELTNAGDPVAKKVFKEEIALRLESGYPSVVEYLLNQGYIRYFTPFEFKTIIESTELIKGLSSNPKMLSRFLKSCGSKFPTLLKDILLRIIKLPKGKLIIISSMNIIETPRMLLMRRSLESNPQYLLSLKNALDNLLRETEGKIGEDIIDIIQAIEIKQKEQNNDFPVSRRYSRLEAIKKIKVDNWALENLEEEMPLHFAKKLMKKAHKVQSKCSYCGKIIQQGHDFCEWCGHQRDDDEGGFFPYPFIFKPPGGGGGSMKEPVAVLVKTEAQV